MARGHAGIFNFRIFQNPFHSQLQEFLCLLSILVLLSVCSVLFVSTEVCFCALVSSPCGPFLLPFRPHLMISFVGGISVFISSYFCGYFDTAGLYPEAADPDLPLLFHPHLVSPYLSFSCCPYLIFVSIRVSLLDAFWTLCSLRFSLCLMFFVFPHVSIPNPPHCLPLPVCDPCTCSLLLSISLGTTFSSTLGPSTLFSPTFLSFLVCPLPILADSDRLFSWLTTDNHSSPMHSALSFPEFPYVSPYH